MSYQLDNHAYDDIIEFMEEYFKRAAVKLLGHTPEKPAYFINYQTDDVSEIQEAISKGIKLPALILDSPDDMIGNGSDGLKTHLSAAISMIDKYDQGSARSLKNVRNRCREILRKVVMQMIRDGYVQFDGILIANRIFLEKDAIQGMYIGKTQGLFTGWTYEFTWYTPDEMMLGVEDFK